MQFIHQDQQTTLTSEITMEGDQHTDVSHNTCSGNEKIKARSQQGVNVLHTRTH